LGDQHLLDVGQERRAVHGPVEHHGRGQAGQSQAGGECRGLPMAVRHARPATLSPAGTTSQAGHLRTGSGLVNEDQPLRIEVDLTVEPGAPSREDVRTLLLRGVRRLFLYVIPRLAKKCQTVDGAARTPCSSASRPAISWRAMSLLATTRSRMNAS